MLTVYLTAVGMKPWDTEMGSGAACLWKMLPEGPASTGLRVEKSQGRKCWLVNVMLCIYKHTHKRLGQGESSWSNIQRGKALYCDWEAMVQTPGTHCPPPSCHSLAERGFQVIKKMKNKIPALCKREIDLGNYFLAAQLFKLQSHAGIGLPFFTGGWKLLSCW